ncbi:MAG TPA: urease accessory protein UreD [Phototrophicaceae bacterium]|nr:urease accessory protein UreD [Phototrophicaceae bacterium]
MSLDRIGRVGELRLTFAQRDGSTVLTENYSRPPLQVMRAIRDDAGCLCIYLLSPTGGVLQGDRYTMAIHVGARAHALFTTQSATKVYRMPDECAEQDIRIEVEPGAIFEFVPDAAILFADADLSQHIHVRLHPGALLILHEIVMPGRLARGECLQFRHYANRITVRDEAGLLLYDAAEIEPASQDLLTIGKLEGQPCWGSFYLLGDLEAWQLNAAEFCAAQQATFAGALGDLSPLHRNGVCARMVSPRLEHIYAAFHGLRRSIRKQIGLPDTPLRK